MWFGCLAIGQGILGHSQEVKEDFRTRSSGQGAELAGQGSRGWIHCVYGSDYPLIYVVEPGYLS